METKADLIIISISNYGAEGKNTISVYVLEQCFSTDGLMLLDTLLSKTALE
jgi:hypothetical protein